MTAPAPVHAAATVILLREAPAGLQTWLLTRRAGLAFAAGMSVYPGGRVDPADSTVPLHPADRARVVAAAFDLPLPQAHAVLVAAARETFEETGVLFAAPSTVSRPVDRAAPSTVSRPVDRAALAQARAAVEAGEAGFGPLLASHGLAVDAAALLPWARWITPEQEHRRYDTAFFVAALPTGADAADVTTESSAAGWVNVQTALTDGRALLPPTLLTLTAVAACATLAEVRAAAAAADLRPVRPVLHRTNAGVVVALPDGRRFPVPVAR